jgi:hypothetical protein
MSVPHRPWLRHTIHGLGFVALLAVAAVITHTTPSYQQWQGPIPVHAEIEQTVSGRNIEATVTQVRVTRSVTTSNGWAGETTGIWVVVDATVAAVVDDDIPLATTELQIGSVTYSASLRPGTSTLANSPLSTGIPRSGSLVFEIPEAVLTSEEGADATVRLAANGDPRSDSIVVVPVDLTTLAIENSITLDATEWGQR